MKKNHATKSRRMFAAAIVLTATLGGLGLAGGCADPPVCECDAAITKLPTSTFPRGGTGTYAIVVDYFGHPFCPGGKVCIDDVLPPGLTYSGAPTAGWTCSGTTAVHCCYNGPLPTTHTTLPVLSLVVNVSEKAPSEIENCATIEQGKRGDFVDADPSNNKSCADADVTDPCPPQPLKLDLSTGMQDAGGASAVGASDDTWSLVASPDPTKIGPAVILQPHPAWQSPPVAGAQWIGPTGGATTGTPGDYTYETCFCLREGFSSPSFDMTLRADNLVQAVNLNGCQLLATPGGPFSGANVHVQSSAAGCR